MLLGAGEHITEITIRYGHIVDAIEFVIAKRDGRITNEKFGDGGGKKSKVSMNSKVLPFLFEVLTKNILFKKRYICIQFYIDIHKLKYIHVENQVLVGVHAPLIKKCLRFDSHQAFPFPHLAFQ